MFLLHKQYISLLNLTLCVYPSEFRNKSWKPECVLSFNMGWRKQRHRKQKQHRKLLTEQQNRLHQKTGVNPDVQKG
jgi:hypothetical protein